MKGSSALIGSGKVEFASEPLLATPLGMQVLGSKPWFCMKKMIRFGVVVTDAAGLVVEPSSWLVEREGATAALAAML
ncbi:MAG: hypothetical protein Aurels2KO_09920 [Aureliella sp.]